MEAERLSELLNEYLSEMAAIALGYGGTIDKFIGDGIMIFFGDPHTNGEKEDAIACVCMALAMRERLRELQTGWHQRGVSRPLHIRIGINSGYSTVGNFGSEDRLDYTIVGGQVNVAARLEAAAEADEILISHQTYALVNDAIEAEPLSEIKVNGNLPPDQDVPRRRAPPRRRRRAAGRGRTSRIQASSRPHDPRRRRSRRGSNLAPTRPSGSRGSPRGRERRHRRLAAAGSEG